MKAKDLFRLGTDNARRNPFVALCVCAAVVILCLYIFNKHGTGGLSDYEPAAGDSAIPAYSPAAEEWPQPEEQP